MRQIAVNIWLYRCPWQYNPRQPTFYRLFIQIEWQMMRSTQFTDSFISSQSQIIIHMIQNEKPDWQDKSRTTWHLIIRHTVCQRCECPKFQPLYYNADYCRNLLHFAIIWIFFEVQRHIAIYSSRSWMPFYTVRFPLIRIDRFIRNNIVRNQSEANMKKITSKLAL